MTPLDSYLSRVARELRSLPESKREEELRELRAHLEQRTEDFAASGLTPQAAQARALREFGSSHSIGSTLCDAWEGVPFSLWRLLSTLVAVTIIWLVTNIALSCGLMAVTFWDQAALLPELPYEIAFVFVAMPFYCGWLLSRKLGRRGPRVTLLYFLSLFLLGLYVRTHIGVGVANSLPLMLFNIVMSLCGAVCAHDLCRRSLRLALANGQALKTTFSLVRAWRSLGLCLISALAISGFIGLRVYTAFHPSTPSGVLRASLLTNQGVSPLDFTPPTILEVRELAPTTAAERANRETRVFFRLEASATPEYAARRIAFLKKELASPQQRKSWGEKALRASLKRLESNRQQVQDVATLVQTPHGWQLDENSFHRSRLWGWCYDIFYDSGR